MATPCTLSLVFLARLVETKGLWKHSRALFGCKHCINPPLYDSSISKTPLVRCHGVEMQHRWYSDSFGHVLDLKLKEYPLSEVRKLPSTVIVYRFHLGDI